MCIRDRFGSEKTTSGRFGGAPVMIAVVPHEWASREDALRAVSYTHLTLPTSDLV